RRRNPDRDVDEEAPAPGVVVSDPPSQRRAEGRSDDDAQQEDRLHQTLLFPGKDLPDGRLGGGEQSGSARALQDAPDHQLGQRAGSTAEKRGRDEDDDRDREIALPADSLGKER